MARLRILKTAPEIAVGSGTSTIPAGNVYPSRLRSLRQFLQDRNKGFDRLSPRNRGLVIKYKKRNAGNTKADSLFFERAHFLGTFTACQKRFNPACFQSRPSCG